MSLTSTAVKEPPSSTNYTVNLTDGVSADGIALHEEKLPAGKPPQTNMDTNESEPMAGEAELPSPFDSQDVRPDSKNCDLPQKQNASQPSVLCGLTIPQQQEAVVTAEMGKDLNLALKKIDIVTPAIGEVTVRVICTGLCRSVRIVLRYAS